ncbi:MAG: FeoA family protein [Giesbergeria sp.]
MPLRVDGWVQGLHLQAQDHERELLLRLVEIGFLPGQRVRVLARAAAGGDPVAVRVGRSTFALRRSEAALVRVGATPPDNAGEPVDTFAAMPVGVPA